ncbi:MAG: preprotein translocase subunit SecE [Firmicutes bacterium ADurb.Bin248]|jgi:preprotein translocase SecE subunit|nr:MAG: preprotein translocase subunit SecE [Firmicutes bacterium ADurb.Bin248]HOG01956.1 preprotein translocase subunit SecE [Clostridia bacterium]HPK14396.1 preprotein translocase subunit SecE [Clostridia bacterium]
MAKDTDKKDKKEKGRSAGPNILQRAGKFFREVYGELKKVTWPTPKELIAYTATVLAFIVIISVMIGVLDFGFGKGFTALSAVDLGAAVSATATPEATPTPEATATPDAAATPAAAN